MAFNTTIARINSLLRNELFLAIPLSGCVYKEHSCLSYHHRHYKGKMEPVDSTSFTELEQRFEMVVICLELEMIPIYGTIIQMKRKHQRTLEQIYKRPTSSNVPWKDIESLFKALGADVSERAGSRVAVVLFSEVRIFHRPHPSPNTDKGAIASIRKWLELYEVKP